MTDLNKIVHDGFSTIADELADLRDRIDNANAPVLAGIGAILRKLEALEQDQAATAEEVHTLRKVGGASR